MYETIYLTGYVWDSIPDWLCVRQYTWLVMYETVYLTGYVQDSDIDW